ncbi:hypothetical protein FB107DRAFT_277034 [Schizophyllum commune]
MTAQQAGRAFPQSEFALRSASRWLYCAPNTLSDSARLSLLPRLVDIFTRRFHVASSVPRHHFLEFQAPPFAEATYLRPPSKGPPRTDHVQASPLAVPTSPPPP